MNPDLSNDAQELVDAGKAALRPSAADKARILHALQPRLQPMQNAAPTPPAAEGLTFGKLVAITAGFVSAVAAIAVYQTRDGDAPSTAPAVTAEPSAPQRHDEDPAPNEAVVATAQVSGPISSTPISKSSSTSVFRPGSASAESDRLGEEVALLTRAQKQFHAGNLNGALSAVEEHQRKFPKGTLAQERVSLRARILCGLGRSAESQAEVGGVSGTDQAKGGNASKPCRNGK